MSYAIASCIAVAGCFTYAAGSINSSPTFMTAGVCSAILSLGYLGGQIAHRMIGG